MEIVFSFVQVEIVACVEGADPISGHKFQARQSWTAADIEFDMAFVSPLSRDTEDGPVRLDWDLFHQLRPVGFRDGSMYV